jgi:hypothetical protein
MKIQTSATPEWFYNSDCFKLETDSNNKNYKSVKQRIYDYKNYPRFTAPKNKIAGHPEYNYVDLLNIQNDENRYDPGQKVGYNIFPKRPHTQSQSNYTNKPFFNGHSNENQYAFKGEGGLIESTTNPLNLDATNEKYQYINGEFNKENPPTSGIGTVLTVPGGITSMQQFMNREHSKEVSKNTKFSVYSLIAYEILYKFYDLQTYKEQLCGYLTNPPTSQMIEGGLDFLLEDIYCVGYGDLFLLIPWGIFEKKIALKQYKLSGKKGYNEFIFLLWSHSEFFGINLFYKKNNGTVINRGENPSASGDPGDSKAPANALFNYSAALAAMTIGDGLLHFIDAVYAWGEFTNENNQIEDLENLPNTNISAAKYFANDSTAINGDSASGYAVRPAIVWMGVNQYASLAIWHAYQNKDIIEDTEFEWETPDFLSPTNSTRRTGNDKQIPYNLYYNEPTFEIKYFNNKTNNKRECLIYACNFNSKKTVPEIVTVILKDKNGNEVNVPIVLKGKKAELVRVTF